MSKIKVLDHGYVELLNIAGPERRPDQLYDADDTDPANVARISFGQKDSGRTREQDLRLAEYLMKNKHSSPWEMIQIWLQMKLPIFVARQLVRHRTCSINEISARYTTLPQEWYIPNVENVNTKAVSNKQGRSDIQHENSDWFVEDLNNTCQGSYDLYKYWLGKGVAPELCRMFLHTNHYCCHIDTPILTQDLRWVPAGTLNTGDMLLAFEEFSYRGPRTTRRLLSSQVKDFTIREDFLYEICLENGDKILCNGEHKWLVNRVSGGSAIWLSTNELAKSSTQWKFRKLFNVWQTGDSYKHGFLAAALDGEGYLTYSTGSGKQCGFAQKDNAMLSYVKECLLDFGVDFSEYKNPISDCITLNIRGGFSTILELLGTTRPPRLLENWLLNTSGGLFSREHVKLKSIKPYGIGKIASFQTSSKTYIANGYACHNTELVWRQDLHNMMHMLSLRDHSHAQWEIQQYAKAIDTLIREQLPNSMMLYDKYRRLEA